MASKAIHVPDLGSFKDVAVIDVLVKPGDTVEVDTPLLTLETDKATMDVPSSAAGVVAELHVQKGAHVSTGSLIATLTVASGADAASAGAANGADTNAADTSKASATVPAAGTTKATETTKPAGTAPRAGDGGGGGPAPAANATPDVAAAADNGSDHPLPAAPAAIPATAAPASATGQPPIGEVGFARAHASPSVRRLARELGVDLIRVQGTASKGRITVQDVNSFVKSVISGVGATGAGAAGSVVWPRVSVPDFSQFGAIEIKPVSRVRRLSGSRLQASWVNLPHVTQFDEADITELEEARKTLKARADRAGIKLTTLAFVVRACVKALQRFPLFNASLDESGENLIYKKYIHIGFAADTPNGLLVPVIRDADSMDIYETARTLAEHAEKARTGKLSGAQMQGGSFTISSLGGIGGTAFTPIINAPEVAILGVSRSSIRPVYRDGAFVPRLMLPLSLSYDHRVIDGVAAVRFTSFLASALAEVRSLVEAVP